MPKHPIPKHAIPDGPMNDDRTTPPVAGEKTPTLTLTLTLTLTPDP